ncbi:hypothetical protein TNCV_3958501 [Trichonephila clavipes]|nr:hypothetical protein TNCV_3958501 [Trichonephila clavipes]
MHVGSPEHFSIIVHYHLPTTYTKRWIKRNGPVAWPSRSLDLNLFYFFFWGYLKSFVYESPMAAVEDFTAWRSSSLQLTLPTHRICLNVSDHHSLVSVCCARINAATASNNSCDNHLSLNF